MNEPPPAPFDPKECSTAEVASCCGVTREAVQSWKTKIDRDAAIWREVKGDRGRGGFQLVWDLPRLIEWRTEHAVSAAILKLRPQGTLSPLEQEQLRKMQLQNDERVGKLVSREELDRQWARAGAELRQQLETIGRRHGAAVANEISRVMKNLGRTIHGLLGSPG